VGHIVQLPSHRRVHRGCCFRLCHSGFGGSVPFICSVRYCGSVLLNSSTPARPAAANHLPASPHPHSTVGAVLRIVHEYRYCWYICCSCNAVWPAADGLQRLLPPERLRFRLPVVHRCVIYLLMNSAALCSTALDIAVVMWLLTFPLVYGLTLQCLYPNLDWTWYRTTGFTCIRMNLRFVTTP